MLAVSLILLLAACGEPSPYEGEWTGVMIGDDEFVTIGDDVGISFTLGSGGKCSFTTDGETSELKWSEENGVLTITDGSDSVIGNITENSITFENFGGSGYNLYVGRNGTDGMNVEQYLPEIYKSMVGTWTSVGVTDILENDISDTVDPAGLTLTFNGDLTMTGSCNGEAFGPWKWSNLGDWGSPEADDVDYISWTIEGDTLKVDYHPGDDWYTYTLNKG